MKNNPYDFFTPSFTDSFTLERYNQGINQEEVN